MADTLATDARTADSPLLEESYEFLGDGDIPCSRYTSSTFARQEFERLWARCWQWACREEHLPDAGDIYV